MVSTAAKDAPLRRHAVVLCCDETYLPLALFVVHQIAGLHPGRSFDICICSDTQLAVPPSLRSLDVKLFQIEPDENYRGLKTTHLPRSAYLRLWIPDALSDHYDRLLYLDADVFLEDGSLEDLLSLDIGDHAVGAVRDMQQWPNPNSQVKEFRMMGWGARPYFNSGVLLIEVERFQGGPVLEKALAFAKAHPEVLLHHDQSLLNCVLYDSWAELSPVWNWQWSAKRPIFSLWADVKLSHFVTGLKPWHDPKGKVPVRYRHAYRRFSSAHFPDFDVTGPQQPTPLDSGRGFIWMALRHLVVRGRVTAYLRRFLHARHVIK